MEKQSDACSGQLDSVSYQLCGRGFLCFVFQLCFRVSRIGDWFYLNFFNGKRGEIAFRTIFLCVVLLVAGVSDFRYRKVYNGWLFMGMAAGVVFWGKDFLFPAGIVLIPVFLLYRLRLIGAGDAKLMALVAGYLGMDAGLEAIGAGLLTGAAWSLCRLLHDRDLRVRLTYLSVYFRRVFLTGMITAYEMPPREDGREQVPLATCLAVGTYLYLFATRACGGGKGI